MRNFRDNLVQADQRGVAIGHFNISDFAALKGVAEAARVLGVPVAVGLSESERKFMGVREKLLGAAAGKKDWLKRGEEVTFRLRLLSAATHGA
jgi:fructose/tagatose bisphosphate aldolase